MKKRWFQKILSGVVFSALLIASVCRINEIVLQKDLNRSFAMDQEIDRLEEAPEVEIFGSCHAYSSFHVPYYQENYGLTAYNMSNPGEFIPITYARMAQQFRKFPPKVALVDSWGMMTYDTYSSHYDITGNYAIVNLESMPRTPEKMEVIDNFWGLDPLELNFPLARYKDRIINRELHEFDFDYSRENVRKWYTEQNDYKNQWILDEIDMRIQDRGSVTWESNPLEHYREQQPDVGDEQIPFEYYLNVYLQRIIDLCREYDVKLIFYRAPYLSTPNELRKCNTLAVFLEEQGIPFYDLEAELDFDPMTDFYDEHHLAEPGMIKATDFLAQRIQEVLE